MDALERTLAAATFGRPDRAPVFLVLLQQGARELGLELEAYFQDGAAIAEGQARLLERYGHDCVFSVPHIVADTLPFGAALRFYRHGPPSVDHMCLDRYEEILDLPVPRAADFPQQRQTLIATRRLAARFGGTVPVVAALVAPFSLPSMLMGTRRYIALLKDETGLRERYLPALMGKCAAYAAQWARDLHEAGADLVVLADGMASADVVTEPEFFESALPVLRDVVPRIPGLKAYEFGGRGEPFIGHLRGLGLAAFLVGSDDNLPACRRSLGHAGALAGNVNNINLVHWDRDRVYDECRKALRQAADPEGGFILANQGPEIPYHAPHENIGAFVDAARDEAAARAGEASRCVQPAAAAL